MDRACMAFSYGDRHVPEGYQCSSCGAHGCKLWRDYNTFLSNLTLSCCNCAGRNQEADVSEIDDEGKVPCVSRYIVAGTMRTDQIGNLVPAVPTEDGATFWGYTSVPAAGVLWWQRLPTRVTP